MRLPVQRGRDSIELKMTPMIDVVFLLLVFFLWTSSFEEPEFTLASAIALPPMATGQSVAEEQQLEEFDEIVVRLQSTGQDEATRIMINDQPIGSRAALRQRLQAIIQLGVQPPVIVAPDDDVAVGQAIEVYDVAQALGFDRVLFAAKAAQ